MYGPGRRLLQPIGELVPVYDAEKTKGLPIGVQIVGRPWGEGVIHVMEVSDGGLAKRGFGPGAGKSGKTHRVNKCLVL